MMSIETEKKPEETEDIKERHLPSLDVAEARIAQALIRYKVRVTKGALPKEEEKVRL